MGDIVVAIVVVIFGVVVVRGHARLLRRRDNKPLRSPNGLRHDRRHPTQGALAGASVVR